MLPGGVPPVRHRGVYRGQQRREGGHEPTRPRASADDDRRKEHAGRLDIFLLAGDAFSARAVEAARIVSDSLGPESS